MRKLRFPKVIVGFCALASAAHAQEKLTSANVDAIQKEMNRLAKDPARATEVLGEGWTVVDRTSYVTDFSGRRVPRPTTQTYYDFPGAQEPSDSHLKIVSKKHEFQLRHRDGAVSQIVFEDSLAQKMGAPITPAKSFVKSESTCYPAPRPTRPPVCRKPRRPSID